LKKKTMIKKILIANRGEIAVRVIRACREMGITNVAVFSDIDAAALHVRMADEAYHIGPSPSVESYLVMEKIIDVAKKSGADAIHPGYGFLSENAKFAQMVMDSGLIWIGPPPKAISEMGDKLQARVTAVNSGAPVVPGFKQKIDNVEQIIGEVRKVGFPILIKAAAGGGGKGMRIVDSEEELPKALTTAANEARSAFGDDRVYFEKYIPKPHHVEIQILADQFGNMVYLGERECSIQRRHQKVIEEAPSPIITPEIRKKMGEAALKIARGCGYVNAGTVEFLVDDNLNFYFLEVNTRLQVEHPVTEMITGIDLVKEQIKIASGEKLSFKQDDIQIRGHAIECRIYAEDPNANFAPSTGTLRSYVEPHGIGVRVDSGVYQGAEIPIFYDPMISKMICWGQTRDEAVGRTRRALTEYRISGVCTTVNFHLAVMDNQNFKKGKLHTHFIAEEFPDMDFSGEEAEHVYEAAAVSACLYDFLENSKLKTKVSHDGGRGDNWTLTGRRMAVNRTAEK
jgi:acetyl-CoA carboxylase biotin carboxylase subunit